MEGSSLRESQRLIETDCRVVGEGMQVGRSTLLEDVTHDFTHQFSRVTATAGIGMSANSADFDEARNARPLACHRNETFSLKDAVEISEFHGPLTERAGLREVGELEHRRNIGGGEPAHRGRGWQCTHLRNHGLAANHLGEGSTAKERPAIRECRLIGEKEAEQSAGACEGAQRFVVPPRLIWHACKRADGRRIPTSLSVRDCKGMMVGEERVQDRIVEKIFAVVPGLRVADDHGRIGVAHGHK